MARSLILAVLVVVVIVVAEARPSKCTITFFNCCQLKILKPGHEPRYGMM